MIRLYSLLCYEVRLLTTLEEACLIGTDGGYKVERLVGKLSAQRRKYALRGY